MNYLKLAGAIAILAALAGIYALGNSHGKDSVQSRWDAAVQSAKDEQQAITTKRTRDASIILERTQSELDKVSADLATANASSSGLLQSANNRVARVTASLNSCSAAASQAATESARVLADVFRRADERAGVLSGIADQAIERGLACEAHYNSLK